MVITRGWQERASEGEGAKEAKCGSAGWKGSRLLGPPEASSAQSQPPWIVENRGRLAAHNLASFSTLRIGCLLLSLFILWIDCGFIPAMQCSMQAGCVMSTVP